MNNDAKAAPLSQIDQALVPVFMEFGAAVHAGQCLESALQLLMGLVSKYDKAEFSGKSSERLDKRNIARTLGELFGALKSHEYFTPAEKKIVHKAIYLRNLLVHSYMVDRAESLIGPEKRKDLIEDIRGKRNTIRKANEIIDEMINRYLQEYDTSLEDLQEQWQPHLGSDEELPDDFYE